MLSWKAESGAQARHAGKQSGLESYPTTPLFRFIVNNANCPKSDDAFLFHVVPSTGSENALMD
jgi:hypothetical protein